MRRVLVRRLGARRARGSKDALARSLLIAINGLSAILAAPFFPFLPDPASGSIVVTLHNALTNGLPRRPTPVLILLWKVFQEETQPLEILSPVAPGYYRRRRRSESGARSLPRGRDDEFVVYTRRAKYSRTESLLERSKIFTA